MKLGKEKEIEVVTLMIEKYCHVVHKTRKGELCKECLELLEYVKYRKSLCPWSENKLFCSNCKIHCHKKFMQIKIEEVMRYSLLDEPTVGQDFNSLKRLVEILNLIHQQTGNTMITITHDKRCVEALSERVLLLKNKNTLVECDNSLIKTYFHY